MLNPLYIVKESLDLPCNNSKDTKLLWNQHCKYLCQSQEIESLTMINATKNITSNDNL